MVTNLNQKNNSGIRKRWRLVYVSEDSVGGDSIVTRGL